MIEKAREMKKLILWFGVSLMICTSGCAAAGGSSEYSLFQSSAPRNQPFRDAVRNWFRGDECDTCNAPAGLPTSPSCNSNVAPLCDQYGSQFNQAQPIYSSAPAQQPIGQGVQLYSDPNLNIGTPVGGSTTTNYPPTSFDAQPSYGTPTDYATPPSYGTPTIATPELPSNLIDPIFDQGSLGVPSGAIQTQPTDAGLGEIPMGPSF